MLWFFTGSYFCYDNPAALQKEIKRDMHVDTSSFMMLYSLYSWPNVIVCFFGGFLVDRVLGVRWGAIIFGLLLLVGHVKCSSLICIEVDGEFFSVHLCRWSFRQSFLGYGSWPIYFWVRLLNLSCSKFLTYKLVLVWAEKTFKLLLMLIQLIGLKVLFDTILRRTNFKFYLF